MNIGYIKKANTPLRIIDKIKGYFNIINVELFEQGYVLKVPIKEDIKGYDKIAEKLMKKLHKLKIDTIIFSDKVINEHPMLYNSIQQILQEKGKDTLDGKKLMNYMNFEIFEYILNIQRERMEEKEIYFLIKKDNDLDLQFLSKFIEKCKIVNIVTNDIERFKKIQDRIYENENILISVSNNKSKSLKKAEYIFNINMDKKDIEKYKINREAIIINFKYDIKYDYNTFAGINVNNIEIDIPDEYIENFETIDEYNEFDKNKLYESLLLKKVYQEKKKAVMLTKNDLEKRKNIVSDIIKQDDIKILGLIGNNGRIDEMEIKNLTKLKR